MLDVGEFVQTPTALHHGIARHSRATDGGNRVRIVVLVQPFFLSFLFSAREVSFRTFRAAGEVTTPKLLSGREKKSVH